MSELSFDSNEAKIAYGIGRQIGDQLRGSDLGELSLTHLFAAIEDSLNQAEMRVPSEELEAAFAELQQKMEEKARAGSEETVKAGEAFLSENKSKAGVQTTESGLQYEVLEEGTGTEHPTKNSKVTVHYHGTLIDGTVFDSSVERGEPISFALKQVIKGWQEGLTYMVEGQKVRLFIPSQLAYGKGGSGPIPPSSTLIFDVELISIK